MRQSGYHSLLDLVEVSLHALLMDAMMWVVHGVQTRSPSWYAAVLIGAMVLWVALRQNQRDMMMMEENGEEEEERDLAVSVAYTLASRRRSSWPARRW